MRGQVGLGDVSLPGLEAYLAELDRRGYAGTSRRRKANAIKLFFAFLEQCGHVDTDVSKKLIPPKVEAKEPRVLSEREYQALLRACSQEVREAGDAWSLPQPAARRCCTGSR